MAAADSGLDAPSKPRSRRLGRQQHSLAQGMKTTAPSPKAGSGDPRNTLDFRELRGSWFLQN